MKELTLVVVLNRAKTISPRDHVNPESITAVHAATRKVFGRYAHTHSEFPGIQ